MSAAGTLAAKLLLPQRAALMAMAVFMVAAMMRLDAVVETHEETAALINRAGRQRMLVQRMALLAGEMALTGNRRRSPVRPRCVAQGGVGVRAVAAPARRRNRFG